MSDEIRQQEINSILWKACDTFRGTIDPSEYKNYILVMLFLKYISDVWAERYAQLSEKHGGDDRRIRQQLKYERFVLPEGCDFESLYADRNADNVGELINEALEAIEDANKAKLSGVFRNIDFNSEAALGRTRQRNERLKHLLEDFHDPRLDLRPSRIGDQDVIGDAYEYLIDRFASGAGKKAGEFYTPPGVSLLLAELLDPQPGDRICDPACGSGSLLIKCARRVGTGNYAVYGQEANGATWALCMMNMFLHDIGVTTSNIKWADTLREPALLGDGGQLLRFNVVVANPPFSLDKWGAEKAEADRWKRFQRGVPPKSKADYAFILHMIETTFTEPSHHGRVGVVVPHGVLFRGGAEGKIRQKLIEENLLEAVVGLPVNLFYGTGIPAAILIFRRDRADDQVVFIDGSQEYQEGTNQNYLSDAHRAKIVAAYKARETVAKYCHVASREEISSNDYNLNIPRYVDTFEEEAAVDLAEVNRKIAELRGRLAVSEERMAGYLKELGLHE